MGQNQRRAVPQLCGSEIETALAFLDFQREVMAIKCDGLNARQLRTALVDSGTTLLGLIAHLIVGERYWFGYISAGVEADRDWDFGMVVPDAAEAAEVLADYRRTWARSDEMVRGIGDPAALTAHPVGERPLPLRWVLAHMAHETARHAGHADIIREQLDGATGR